MKHNEHFANLAEELMIHRRGELLRRRMDATLPALTHAEAAQLEQLNQLLDRPCYRRCSECCGVGRVRFAYMAIVAKGGYIISIADEDQAAHSPQRLHNFPTYEAATAMAKELNEANGLTEKQAFQIVASSMRASNLKERTA